MATANGEESYFKLAAASGEGQIEWGVEFWIFRSHNLVFWLILRQNVRVEWVF